MAKSLEEIIEKLKKLKEKYGDEYIIKNYEEEVIELNNPAVSYYMAKNIKGANIKKHREIIKESKDALHALLYVTTIEDGNPLDFESVILEYGTEVESWNFAKKIKGANIKKHQEKILKSKNASIIYALARDVEGVDIKLLEDALIEIHDIFYIALFAKNIEGADVEKLAKIVEDTDEDISLFCKAIIGVAKDKSKVKNKILTYPKN